MGNWYNVYPEETPIDKMSDAYINHLIGLIARGGEWSAENVLGSIDDLYRVAEERNMIKGLVAWALKKYTVRLWKRIAKAGGKKYVWKTPKWVDWMLNKYVLRKDY
jgi:hypothetical protein